jgi:hypothetical protein
VDVSLVYEAVEFPGPLPAFSAPAIFSVYSYE